jgi:peroxiredoxin
MLDLGTPLPGFSLPDTRSGQLVSSTQAKGKITVVAFICNHCPFVIHLKDAISKFGEYCKEKNIAFFAISSNDVSSHPSDAPEKMRQDAERFGYGFPYLYDETQEVARAFHAACTPDFFVFDQQGLLAYRGRFDESSPGNAKPITGRDLRGAVDALLAGQTPSADQVPSVGCNIKWKAS